ncbi:MAG: alpha/beta hydrolase [Planctomycetota bacterium]
MASSDGITIYGEVAVAEDARGTICLFHQGGSNTRGEYGDHILPRLVEAGYNIVTIDARAGGDWIGGDNRTAAGLPEGYSEEGYEHAYPDLVAAFEYATERFDGAMFVWGSSYSGALVMKLATEHPEDIDAVLAFSPASNARAMGPVAANRLVGDVPVPTLIAWPPNEWERDTVIETREKAEAKGFEIHLQPQGVHGSSMLHPDRVEGGSEELWGKVLAFLESNSAG